MVWHNSAEALKSPGTVGRVVEGAIMRIVDEQGRNVKQGEVGEIYLRGPPLSDFTYNNDDAKQLEIALGDLVTVGDVGYQDPDGYLFLCDRRRDMIISGGVNIYPAEIESVLIRMPGVRDCAVFGIPDEEFGEQICAHVEPLAGASIDATAVRSCPASIWRATSCRRWSSSARHFRAKNSGKIFKRKLRAPYWEKAGRSIEGVAMADDDAYGLCRDRQVERARGPQAAASIRSGKSPAPASSTDGLCPFSRQSAPPGKPGWCRILARLR